MRLHRNKYGFNYLLDNEAIVGIVALRFLFFFILSLRDYHLPVIHNNQANIS